jgi:hypothetical protein
VCFFRPKANEELIFPSLVRDFFDIDQKIKAPAMTFHCFALLSFCAPDDHPYLSFTRHISFLYMTSINVRPMVACGLVEVASGLQLEAARLEYLGNKLAQDGKVGHARKGWDLQAYEGMILLGGGSTTENAGPIDLWFGHMIRRAGALTMNTRCKRKRLSGIASSAMIFTSRRLI